MFNNVWSFIRYFLQWYSVDLLFSSLNSGLMWLPSYKIAYCRRIALLLFFMKSCGLWLWVESCWVQSWTPVWLRSWASDSERRSEIHVRQRELKRVFIIVFWRFRVIFFCLIEGSEDHSLTDIFKRPKLKGGYYSQSMNSISIRQCLISCEFFPA